MAALHSRFEHYSFALWFLLSFFFSDIAIFVLKRDVKLQLTLLSFYLFSLPILSRRRLDVYRTSTHDVALVRI